MSSFVPITSLFLFIIPFIIGYLVIRMAVRHGIDSSEVGRAILRKHNHSSHEPDDKHR